MKKQITVLFGGASAEYEVSLQSATGVINGIDRDLYEVNLIGISQTGEWFLYEGPVEKIARDEWQSSGQISEVQFNFKSAQAGFLVIKNNQQIYLPTDLVFPVLHGRNGEDGTVQGLLKLAGLNYVGCGILSSALGTDKYLTQQIVGQLGINVTPALKFTHRQRDWAQVEEFTATHGFPVFVKPVRAGSSYGITKVHCEEELAKAFDVAYQYDSQVTLEKAVPGFEVGCGVMGNQTLIVGGVDEIELSQGFFDYTEKYELLSAKIHCPARISAETREEVRQAAAKIYQALDCHGLARIDFFLQPDGQLVFNEINTLPGFTPHSRFPQLMGEVGLSYQAVVNQLIEFGLAGDV